jgi:hypothetical protein
MDAIKEAMIREEDTGEINPALDPYRERPETCPTCGATSYSENCRYRYEDVGCDHPALLRDVGKALGL